MLSFRKNKSSSMILSTIAIIIACVLIVAIGWQAILLTVRSSPDLMVYELANNANIAYSAPEDVSIIKVFPTNFFSGCPIGSAMFGTSSGSGSKFGEGRIGVGRCIDGCFVYMETMYGILAAILGSDIAMIWIPGVNALKVAANKIAVEEGTKVTAKIVLKAMTQIVAQKVAAAKVAMAAAKASLVQRIKNVATLGFSNTIKEFLKRQITRLMPRTFSKAATPGLVLAREATIDGVVVEMVKDATGRYVAKEAKKSMSVILLKRITAYGIPAVAIGSVTKYFECCTPGAVGRDLGRAAFSMIPVVGPATDMAQLLIEIKDCKENIKFYYYVPSTTTTTTFDGTSGSAWASGYQNYADAPQILTYNKKFDEHTKACELELSV